MFDLGQEVTDQEQVNPLLEVLNARCASEDEYPTLKNFADVIGVPPQRVYSVSKQPEAGKVFDPGTINWAAMSRFCTRRLDESLGIPTLEDIVDKALELKNAIQEKRASRRVNGSGVSGKKVVEGIYTSRDGSVMPPRRALVVEGQCIMMKKDKYPDVYEVMMVTDTHICVQLQGTPLLKVFSNWTLNQQGITDENMIEAMIEERTFEQFSGTSESAADEYEVSIAEDVIESTIDVPDYVKYAEDSSADETVLY